MERVGAAVGGKTVPMLPRRSHRSARTRKSTRRWSKGWEGCHLGVRGSGLPGRVRAGCSRMPVVGGRRGLRRRRALSVSGAQRRTAEGYFVNVAVVGVARWTSTHGRGDSPRRGGTWFRTAMRSWSLGKKTENKTNKNDVVKMNVGREGPASPEGFKMPREGANMFRRRILNDELMGLVRDGVQGCFPATSGLHPCTLHLQLVARNSVAMATRLPKLQDVAASACH